MLLCHLRWPPPEVAGKVLSSLCLELQDLFCALPLMCSRASARSFNPHASLTPMPVLGHKVLRAVFQRSLSWRLAVVGIWPGKTLGEIIAASISVFSKELCGTICTMWADSNHITDLKVAALGFVKAFFLHSPPVSAGQRKSFWTRWFRIEESSTLCKQLCESGKNKKRDFFYPKQQQDHCRGQNGQGCKNLLKMYELLLNCFALVSGASQGVVFNLNFYEDKPNEDLVCSISDCNLKCCSGCL